MSSVVSTSGSTYTIVRISYVTNNNTIASCEIVRKFSSYCCRWTTKSTGSNESWISVIIIVICRSNCGLIKVCIIRATISSRTGFLNNKSIFWCFGTRKFFWNYNSNLINLFIKASCIGNSLNIRCF